MERRLLIGLLTVGLLTGNVAFAAAASAEEHEDDTLEFGMGPNSIQPQKANGIAPDYQTEWVGPWNLESGWGGTNDHLERMQSEGVTPAIHLYYWGDDISPTCVEEGCWSDIHDTYKHKQDWQNLTQELVDNLWATMDGDRVVILLETEFNKGGIEDYEPFDTYLTEKIQFINKHYPAAEIVVPFGNWGRTHWSNFDQAAAASDYVGLQGMRGSTQDSYDSYRYLYEDTVQGTQYLQDLFGESIFLHDIALSSYPEPDYLDPQANELSEFFEGMGELKANGVEAMIYRSWFNNPNMDTSNYYGEAERHWGFAYADTKEHKPAAQVWIDGVKAERGGETTRTGTDVNGSLSFEAENFDTKSTGGLTSDADASNGEAWNLWADGYVSHAFNFTPNGTYEVAVDARGTPANGTQAHMEVALGTDTVVATHVSDTYETYTAPVNASEVEDLTIAFTNDKMTDTEDRNLIVDRVTLTEVDHPPNASFTAATDGLNATFTSNASDPDGDALNHTWDLGDGTSANGTNVTHAYDKAGTYNVTLTVDDGELSDQANATVTVEEPNHAPNASFDTQTDGLNATFTANASDPDGDALAYEWTLGDGTAARNATVEHAYDEAGTYNVTLTVTDGELSDQANATVTVEEPNHAPNASFDTQTDGLNATFTANASDPDGDALNHTWDLGDGTSANGTNVTHAYDEAGTYNVTLTVSDGEFTDEVRQAITVERPNRAPQATFDVSVDGLNATLEANASDPDGDELTYAWSLGDGTSAQGANLTHAYDEAGTYNVTLNVSDGELSDREQRPVDVERPNAAPNASFAVATHGLNATFDAANSTDPDGDELTHTWELGDGTNATGENVTHAYATGGTYNATLTVSDGNETDRVTHEVTVEAENSPPTATFEPHVEGNTVYLDGTNSTDPDGDALDYRWWLGDGGGYHEATANHTYAEPGTYQITLRVDDGNHTDRAWRTVTIENREPTATFEPHVEGNTVHLDGTNSTDPDGDALDYRWWLGDGGGYHKGQASHTYAEPGTYQITLRVDDGNATDRAWRTVTIENSEPTATFQPRVEGQTVHLDGTNSTDPDGDALSYRWWLGDGGGYHEATANHTYAEPGTYQITLRVDDGNATDRAWRTVTVEASTYEATFTPKSQDNEWWIETDVDASKDPQRVEARIDGGAWFDLEKQDWGSWAKSTHVDPGSEVEFRATGPDGGQAVSQPYTWAAEDAFDPTFTPKSQDNEWWIETDVDAEATVDRVQARIDGGAWFDLEKQDWGSWAKSTHVDPGSEVQFKATDADGREAKSATYTWG